MYIIISCCSWEVNQYHIVVSPKFTPLLSLQRWRSHLGNKRYLATGWSRGRFGNLEFMEEEWNVERLQYGKKIREKKERRAQLYHFFLTQDPPPFLALVKLAGSTRVSLAVCSHILDNWYIRLIANNCFRALKWQKARI